MCIVVVFVFGNNVKMKYRCYRVGLVFVVVEDIKILVVKVLFVCVFFILSYFFVFFFRVC